MPTYRPLVSIPWGSGPTDMPLELVDYPLFSYMAEGQRRQVHAPIHVRVDREGGVHALPAVPSTQGESAIVMHHFAADGRLSRTNSIHVDQPGATDWRILDYAVGGDGACFVLESLESASGESSRVRRINADGTVQWTRPSGDSEADSDSDVLAGRPERLLIDDDDAVYLPSTCSPFGWVRLDSESGQLTDTFALGKPGTPVGIAAGKAYRVLFDAERNQRSVACFDTGTGQEIEGSSNESLFGWLLYPFGVDRSGFVYSALHSQIARISLGGQVERIDRIENAVVRYADGAVLLSRSRSDLDPEHAVDVEVHPELGAPEHRTLSIPPALEAGDPPDWQLVHADGDGRFFVFGGEAPGRAGTLLVFDTDGTLVETKVAPPDLLAIESRLQMFRYWAVGPNGGVYLPLTDPEGFKVLVLELWQT